MAARVEARRGIDPLTKLPVELAELVFRELPFDERMCVPHPRIPRRRR